MRKDRTFADTRESAIAKSNRVRASKGQQTREKILTLLRMGDILKTDLAEKVGLSIGGLDHHLKEIVHHRPTWRRLGEEWVPVLRLGKGKSRLKPRPCIMPESTLVLAPGQQIHDFFLMPRHREPILKKAAKELSRGAIAKLEWRLAA